MFQWDEPFVCFVAGALLPTLAYLFLFRTREAQRYGELSGNDKDEEEDEDDEDLRDMPSPSATASKWGYTDAPYKMVLCVNTSLTMGKGKIAAQCCHAAVGCYKRARRSIPKAVTAWEHTGCAKIATKCPTQEEMEEIAVKAIEKGIPVYLVEDAGRTQIAPGSKTVLGLGPAPVAVFEGISNHLKLM